MFLDVFLSPVINEDILFQALTINNVYPSSLKDAISQLIAKGELKYYEREQVQTSFFTKALTCCKHGVAQLPTATNILIHMPILNRFTSEFINWASTSY